MARTIGLLTALKVDKAKRAGMYADGGGLYLRVTEDGTKNWVYRFMLRGRSRWMGLGPLALYGLHEARGKALDARRLRHEGVDPIETRRAARLRERLEAAKAMTFKQCAESYIADHRAEWHNPKHAAQWEATLETYAYHVIDALPVQAIDTGLVLRVLEPIWTAKPETAGRVRGRIERVLDGAKARGYRVGENPARWKGHLDQLLPARSKVRKVRHHPALPYAELPDFMVALRGQEGVSARALEFTILTAARTGETIGAKWSELDLADKIWTIPAERMKAGKEHRVPLCARALAILEELKKVGGKFVFPGAKAGKPLSNMAMLELVRGMNERREAMGKPKWMDPRQGKEIVPHGFRSTFKDWASDRTSFPRDMVEIALAHTLDDKTEAAYRRSDMFEKRRRLMGAWAELCGKPLAAGRVVALHPEAAKRHAS
jgi:integrase